MKKYILIFLIILCGFFSYSQDYSKIYGNLKIVYGSQEIIISQDLINSYLLSNNNSPWIISKIDKLKFKDGSLQQSASNIQLKQKNISVYKKRDTLWIAHKYNESQDIVYHFGTLSRNEVPLISVPFFITNKQNFPIIEFSGTPNPNYFEKGIILQGAISPLTGSAEWLGGNHVLKVDTSFMTATFTFNSDDSLEVDDGTAHNPSGGYVLLGVSGMYLKYDTVVNNKLGGLTHIHGNRNYTHLIGTDVIEYLQTETLISFDVYNNEDTLIDNKNYWGDSLKLRLITALFDIRTLDYNTQDTVIIDTTYYVFTENGFKISVTKDFLDTLFISRYTGIQGYAQVSDSIYYGHSQHDWLIHPSINTDAGNYSAGYDSVEKVIVTPLSDSLCMEFKLDRSYGLGAEIPNNWNTEDHPIFYRSAAKIYSRLIEADTIYKGLKKWRATITYWDNDSVNSFFHKYYMNGDRFSIDKKDNSDIYITSPPLTDYKYTLNTQDANTSYSISYDTLIVTSTGHGNLDFNISNTFDFVNLVDRSKIFYLFNDTITSIDEKDLRIGSYSDNKSLNVFGNLNTKYGDINIGPTTDIYLGNETTFWVNSVDKFLRWNGLSLAFGSDAGNPNSFTGNYNTLVGMSSGIRLTSGAKNTFIGAQSGSGVTIENDNTFIGYNAGFATTGDETKNVAVGSRAGELASKECVYIGANSAKKNSGIRNVAIGYNTLTYSGTSTGSNNVCLGAYAGGLYTGSSSVFIGYQVGFNGITGNNLLMIDNHNTDEALIQGDFNADTLRINGGLSVKSANFRNITEVDTAIYDLLATDYILHVIYTSTAAVSSLTIPSVQTIQGRIIIIKDAGGNANTNTITIDTEGSETIDGSATYVLDADYESIMLYCDGENWFTF